MEMKAATTTGVTAGTGGTTLDHTVTLFSVKEEPIDFDLMVKVPDEMPHDLLEPSESEEQDIKVFPSMNAPAVSTTTVTVPSTTATSTITAVPQIGSSNSAFQPYKQQSLTILTNLQRGNVKTTNKENGPESLTFHEKAAKATLTESDITESTVNAKDPSGFTPLMWAAFHGRLSIVQKIIERGAQIDCYGPEGETALMFAACNGHSEVLTYLLSQGASADTEDDAGNTALMFAAHGNHSDCVVQLLRCGARMNKPNGIGDTPFEIAINKGHIAAQYAMEDFLKEELEMSYLSELSSDTATKSQNNISDNSTSPAAAAISNGNCKSNSNSKGSSSSKGSDSVVNCNGVGNRMGGTGLVVENGSPAFTQKPSSS